ncbi:MAG: lysylphosphatidylglycerol synthase transmembrane domain-containing protein [Bacteroidetes bacterium]|nr:lysylphosphatidylglycerol synthase transmembrane domain-containing protein [Bacteroidota bacterium]
MSSERLIKSLKSLLPIGLGVFLVVYSYLSTDETIRSQIYFYIRQANPLYVGLSLLFALLSHVSRAIRWNYLLRPLGYQTPLLSSFYFVMMAYFANLGIPRSGEVLRATSLRTYEKVPFEKGFGTIVTERIIDLVMLFIVISVTLFLQTERLTTLMASNKKALVISVLVIIIAVVGLWVSIAVLKKSTSAIAQKLTRFLEGIQSGLLSVFKMKQKGYFIAHTLFIWGCYVAMFWVIKYTLPETESLGLSELLVAFIAGSFAMTATNGGVGLYPIAVRASLALFGISFASGEAFGWILWISQTLMIVLCGAFCFLSLPLIYRKRS